MAEEGHIPPRNHGRKEVSAPMEYETPPEILPIEMTFNFPYSSVHFYLLVFDYFLKHLLSLLIIFGFLLEQLLLQYLFKPKGVGTFFSTALNLMKEHSRPCYVLTTKIITTKWTDPTRVKFIQFQKVDGPNQGQTYKSTKWTDPTKGQTYKSTKWTDPTRVKLTSP